jgi:hypothetical protein
MRERSGEERVEEVTGEPLYRDRVCGTGIGKGRAGRDDPGAIRS